LRPGGVAREAIEAVLGRPLAIGSATPAPGTLPSHYAPHAKVIAVDVAEIAAAVAAATRPTAVLAPADVIARLVASGALPDGVTALALPDDARAMAHDLYAALRDLDGRGVATIVAALPPEAGLGAAVADRLRRAAGPRTGEDDHG
jgi:L-threonylcarbamoyladenylate synthase